MGMCRSVAQGNLGGERRCGDRHAKNPTQPFHLNEIEQEEVGCRKWLRLPCFGCALPYQQSELAMEISVCIITLLIAHEMTRPNLFFLLAGTGSAHQLK